MEKQKTFETNEQKLSKLIKKYTKLTKKKTDIENEIIYLTKHINEYKELIQRTA